MAFPDFQTKWLGNKVADPLLGGDHPYQCVSFVKQYLRECFSLEAGWWGNAIDYWYKTNPAMLTKFSREATRDVQQGDVVVLETNASPLQPGLQPGHIGLATGNQNTFQFELLEQNGQTGNGLADNPGDLIRLRWVSKNRIAGVIRPVPIPAPNPQPVCSYTPEVPAKVMQAKLPVTNWWGLNVFSDNIGDFQPSATLSQGTPFTIGGYAVNKHFPQYRYAMTPEDFARALAGDYSTNNGINVLDLEDVPPAKPYVPPAAPITAKKPAKLTLVADVPAYETGLAAWNNKGRVGTLVAGEYFIHDSNNGMLNLSSDNMNPGFWVNPDDNHEPVIVPVEVKPPPPDPLPIPGLALKPSQVPIGSANDTSWKVMTSFHPDRSPDTYEMLIDYVASDYAGSKQPVHLHEGRRLNVPGTFVKNGVVFYRLRDYKHDVEFKWYFGIPKFDDFGNPTMKKIVKELPKSWSDLFHAWRDDARNMLGTSKVWDVLLRTKIKK